MRGSYPWSRRRCRGRWLRGPGADLGRPRDPFPGASRPRGQTGPKRPGQRSFLFLCEPREGWALPVSRCAELGQTSKPLGRALSAVLKEARPPTSPDCACRPRLLLSALPHIPAPAAPPSQVPGPSARPTPRPSLGSSLGQLRPELQSCPEAEDSPQAGAPPYSSALSRLRPPGSIVQAAGPQSSIGLQSRLVLRLWSQGAARTLGAGWMDGGAVCGAEGGAAAHLPRLSLLPNWKGEFTETLLPQATLTTGDLSTTKQGSVGDTSGPHRRGAEGPLEGPPGPECG
ncbi:hypothetical protein CapIbe_009838 [Capra ibex]